MKHARLVLTESQTEFIRRYGFRFAVGSPVLIGSTGLAVLNLFECDRDTSNDACKVAMGTCKAVPVDPVTPESTTPATMPLRGFCGQ